MSAFEFLFSLFGLLLGLSIAELAGGFSRLYDQRKVRPIGWLAPGLAAVLLLDLLTFWYGAWFFRRLELNFWLVLGAGIVGLLYYSARGLSACSIISRPPKCSRARVRPSPDPTM